MEKCFHPVPLSGDRPGFTRCIVIELICFVIVAGLIDGEEWAPMARGVL
jgi:hypothetical protein